MDQMNNKVKTCIGCIYYYVTWDKSKPKGCKYFGFKSMQMPCTVFSNQVVNAVICIQRKAERKDE